MKNSKKINVDNLATGRSAPYNPVGKGLSASGVAPPPPPFEVNSSRPSLLMDFLQVHQSWAAE